MLLGVSLLGIYHTLRGEGMLHYYKFLVSPHFPPTVLYPFKLRELRKIMGIVTIFPIDGARMIFP